MVVSNTGPTPSDSIAQSDSSAAKTQDERAEERKVVKSSIAHVARSTSDKQDHNTLVLMWDDFPFSV